MFLDTITTGLHFLLKLTNKTSVLFLLIIKLLVIFFYSINAPFLFFFIIILFLIKFIFEIKKIYQ